jgi:hypothetical protein
VAALGPDVRLPIIMAVPRCIMTVLGQEELPRDNTVLQVIAKNNRLNVPVLGPSPCAGVYGTVHRGGVVRRGDIVTLANAADDEALGVDDPATKAAFKAMAASMERVMEQLKPR